MTMTETAPNAQGYKTFTLGGFTFRRDEYFATVTWPTGSHQMAVDEFLRSVQRDVAWGFFYGIVNFDEVFGTMNHYGNVDMFAGRFNEAYRKAEVDYNENFSHDDLLETFQGDPRRLDQRGVRPVRRRRWRPAAVRAEQRWQRRRDHTAPGGRRADGRRARRRGDPHRRVGIHDQPCFADVPQDEPVVDAEPGYESEVAAFNLFAYLSRSDVTWNPSVVSACKESLYCPTTEEFILPIIHGNDRVEWFVQLSDEIRWDVEDRDTGRQAGTGDHEGRRRRCDAGRHPPSGLLAQAFDAARLGERVAADSRDDRQRRGLRPRRRLLIAAHSGGSRVRRPRRRDRAPRARR